MANVSRAIVNKEDEIRLCLVTLLCEGHLLIEDVPGVGKTMLAKALARSLDCTFRRIQFTPDLLPSDVTGVRAFNQKENDFEFRPGPVFAQILLADEINRASPKTQSALLEAMEERQVTADGDTRRLPRPFCVLATENPIELEGTFPLPEAQLDRFLLRVALGYPTREEERTIARRFQATNPLDGLESVLPADEIDDLAQLCRRVFVGDAVDGYIVDLVRATREVAGVTLGASPRATLALFRASQALAAIGGRGFVLPDDVKQLAVPVLGHRLIVNAQGRLDGRAASDVVAEVIARVPAPVEDQTSIGA
jgi:MoxR-like ATPase